ncbi:hypothetical protein [Dorea longicatena]|uniref:hypothetical protein n=1 Tax=Dorea longicatena TaxID=88431 RepID=UPI0022E5CDDF|nr:hypothetical protein [Dorea longicatena]
MAYTPLSTDFKDQILSDVNTQRKYKQTVNEDGTVSLRDMTAYDQEGSTYSAKDIIEEREAINNIYANKVVSLDEASLVTEPGFFCDALVINEINKSLSNKYRYIFSTYLDNEKSTKTSLTLNRIKATGHGRKCILMCWGAMKVTTLTARLSVYVNGKDSCSGITSSTSYVPVFDSNIITLPEGENTIELRLSAQANTATAYIGRYHKLGFIVAEL